ncbi:MAG: hypothetical protein R2698_07935 [Microthrixaceae bacterium]
MVAEFHHLHPEDTGCQEAEGSHDRDRDAQRSDVVGPTVVDVFVAPVFVAVGARPPDDHDDGDHRRERRGRDDEGLAQGRRSHGPHDRRDEPPGTTRTVRGPAIAPAPPEREARHRRDTRADGERFGEHHAIPHPQTAPRAPAQ